MTVWSWLLERWDTLRGSCSLAVKYGPATPPEHRGVWLELGPISADVDWWGFAVATPWWTLLSNDRLDNDSEDEDPDEPEMIVYHLRDTALWGLVRDGAVDAHNGTDPEIAACMVMAKLDLSDAAGNVEQGAAS